MAASSFEILSPGHLCALGAIALTCCGAYAAGRRGHRRLGGWVLAPGLVALSAAVQWQLWRSGRWESTWALPLDLCDLALLCTVLSLWTGRRLLFELAYFWGFSGSLLALLTPDLRHGFPDLVCLGFFGAHGGVLVGVALLLGQGQRPVPGSAARAFTVTLAYAGVLGVVNELLDANYMYLCNKPAQATPLDYLGPWPWYLGSGAAIAALVFFLMELPYRRRAPA